VEWERPRRRLNGWPSEPYGREALVKKAVIGAVVAVVGLGVSAQAQGEKPLGDVQIGVKGNYIAFTHKDMKDEKLEKGGLAGAFLYLGVAEGFYIGAEGAAAYAEHKEGDRKGSLTYIPIEANAKLVVKPADWLALSVGGGGCYGHTKVEEQLGDDKGDVQKWVLGGQAFAEANLLFGPFFLGANSKYQITQKFEDADFNLNNWQVGGQLGFKF
jgi:hypothetical protein